MADLNFIKTNAMEIHDEIIAELENGVSEPLFPGDERRIFGEALVPLFVGMFGAVNDAARQKMLRYARGSVLDALGENRGIKRLESVSARTTIRFSVSPPLSQNLIIPIGTRVTGDYTRYFATTSTAVLAAGMNYVDVPAESVGGGSEFNDIPVGEINVLVDLSNAPMIDNVTNITVTFGGGDAESDEQFRDRIRDAPNSMSTAGPAVAYRYFAIAADPLIADASVTSPSPGTVLVVPICYGGEIPDAYLLDKVLASVSAPDVRPLTDRVLVAAPTAAYYDIELTYYTTAANASQVYDMVELPGGAIDRYIFWQGSSLDNDINPDQLRKRILAPDWEPGLIGADRVEIVKPVFTVLNSQTVAKFSGNLNVTRIIT